MTLLYQPPTPLVGSTGLVPCPKFMASGDTYDTIVTPGYLTQSDLPYPLSANDLIFCFYLYNPVTQTSSGNFDIFFVSITDGIITLQGW